MLETKKRKAIAYCRVSSESQEENTSLEEQENKIRAFAVSQDIEVLAVYRDVSSGGNVNRPGYQAAIKHLWKSKASCFIVAKFDRAHRHQENLLVFERELREKGVSFLSVFEMLDSASATGRLMFQILGSFAEFEKNQINERTKSGRKAKLEKDSNAGGRPPIGYNPDFTVNEDAEMVEKLFAWYMETGSLAKVKAKADKAGLVSPKGKAFSRQAVHVVLSNRAYIGEYAYDGRTEKNGKKIVAHHPAIVSKILFGRVQKKLAENRKAG